MSDPNIPGTEIEVADSATEASIRTAIADLRAGQVALYSTIKGTDAASRMAVLEAVTNAEKGGQHINKPFKLANFVAQQIEVTNPETGAVTSAVRSVLIDPNGKSIAFVSTGIFKFLQNLVGILGEPTLWDGPVTVTPVKQGTAPREYTTLKIG